MTLRRRLVAAVTAGALVLGGLAACRADPAAIAYVGDRKITSAEVEAVVKELTRTLRDEVDAGLTHSEDDHTPEELGQLRDQRLADLDQRLEGANEWVAMLIVLAAAGTRYADTHGIEVPDSAPTGVADRLRLAVDNPYVTVLAEFLAVMNALQRHAAPSEPSETDQREVFKNLRLGGEPIPDEFEEVQPYLTAEAMGPQVGLRDLLVEAVDEADVVVNPRYDLVYQVQIQLGQATSWLAVPLGEELRAVVDDS